MRTQALNDPIPPNRSAQAIVNFTAGKISGAMCSDFDAPHRHMPIQPSGFPALDIACEDLKGWTLAGRRSRAVSFGQAGRAGCELFVLGLAGKGIVDFCVVDDFTQ